MNISTIYIAEMHFNVNQYRVEYAYVYGDNGAITYTFRVTIKSVEHVGKSNLELLNIKHPNYLHKYLQHQRGAIDMLVKYGQYQLIMPETYGDNIEVIELVKAAPVGARIDATPYLRIHIDPTRAYEPVDIRVETNIPFWLFKEFCIREAIEVLHDGFMHLKNPLWFEANIRSINDFMHALQRPSIMGGGAKPLALSIEFFHMFFAEYNYLATRVEGITLTPTESDCELEIPQPLIYIDRYTQEAPRVGVSLLYVLERTNQDIYYDYAINGDPRRDIYAQHMRYFCVGGGLTRIKGVAKEYKTHIGVDAV